MDTDISFSSVMSQLEAGDPEATAVVSRLFVHRLIALASCQFEASYRSKEDPEEVVNSVYKSFFRRYNGKQVEFNDWDALWALLAKITVRKCIDRYHYYHAECRDINREDAPRPDSDEEAWRQAVHKGPTPEQTTVLIETVEELIRPLNDSHRAIAEMSFEGYTGVEIADRCVCSERTVSRVLSWVRRRLEKLEERGRDEI